MAKAPRRGLPWSVQERAGQALVGHASLEMVQHFAQMIDDDLLQA